MLYEVITALEAGKQFNNYIRSILIGKGKFQRTHINLLKKAVDRKTKDKAVKVGTRITSYNVCYTKLLRLCGYEKQILLILKYTIAYSES